MSKHIKIVILSENFRLDHLGGAETSIFLIAQGLCRLGAEVTIVTFGEFNATKAFTVDGKLKIVSVSSPEASDLSGNQSVLYNKAYLDEIIEVIKAECPDIIQVHIINNTIQLKGLKIFYNKLNNIPFVITFHDCHIICSGDFRCKVPELLLPEYDQKGLFRKPYFIKCIWCGKSINRALKRIQNVHFINQKFKKIYYVSKFTRKLFEDNGADSSLGRVLYNGDNYRSACYHHAPLDWPHVNIIMGGRMKWKKGYHQVIYALGKLQNKTLKMISLTIYGGDNNYCQYLKKITKEGNLDDYVHFTGWLGKDELFKLRKNSHIAIIPSLLSDPLPRVAFEYMASGVAVIATTVGGAKEAIIHNHNGLIVDPYDTKNIADAICLLLRNPNLIDKFTSNAIIDLKNRFSTLYNCQQRLSDYFNMIK